MSDALSQKSLKSRVSDELNALRKQEIAKHRRGNFKDEGSAFLTPEEAKNYLLELQSKKKKKKVQSNPPTNLPTTELNDWYSQQRKMHLIEQKKRVEAETFLRGYRSKYVKKDDDKKTDDNMTKVPMNDITDSIIEEGLDNVMLEVDKLNQSKIEDGDNDEECEVDEVVINIDKDGNKDKEEDKDENNDKDKDEDKEEKQSEDNHDQQDEKTEEDIVNIENENEKVDSSLSHKSDDDKDNEDADADDKDNENNVQSNEVEKEEPADSQITTDDDDDDNNVNDDQNSNDVTKDSEPIDGSEQTTESEVIDEESKNEPKVDQEEGKNDESEIDQEEEDETKVVDQEGKCDEPEIDQKEMGEPKNDQEGVLSKEPTELEEVVPDASTETEKEVLENEKEVVNEEEEVEIVENKEEVVKEEEIVENEEEIVKEEEIVENEEDVLKEEEEEKYEVTLVEDNENTIATEREEPEETTNDNEEEEVINEDKIEEEEDKMDLKEEVTEEEESSEDISHTRGLHRTDSFVVRKESSDKDSAADVEEEESWRDMISREPGAKFAPEPDRYHLYVSHACPWAHRTVIVLALKGLEKVIGLTYVHPTWQYTKPGVDEHRGWVFGSDDGKPLSSTSGAGSFPTSWGEEDPNMGAKTIRDIYEEVNDTTERYILPILWDNKLKTIVSNESSEIIRMLNLEFNEYASNPDLDLYPESLVEQIDEINQWIYPSFNNGVYRCGLASTQECYDVAIDELTEAFDKIDSILQKQRYIAGDTFTEADVRLFVTLIRFDEVYDIYFKTNTRSVSSTPAVLNYVRDIYQMDNVAKTCVMDMIKAHYYTSHVELNKYSIIPRGVNFIALLDKPHHRESLS